MKKQTANMMTYFFRGALLLALLFLVIRVIPGAFGQRNNQISKAEVTRAAIMRESARTDVPLTKQRTSCLQPRRRATWTEHWGPRRQAVRPVP